MWGRCLTGPTPDRKLIPTLASLKELSPETAGFLLKVAYELWNQRWRDRRAEGSCRGNILVHTKSHIFSNFTPLLDYLRPGSNSTAFVLM